jgi:hypothetical protein
VSFMGETTRSGHAPDQDMYWGCSLAAWKCMAIQTGRAKLEKGLKQVTAKIERASKAAMEAPVGRGKSTRSRLTALCQAREQYLLQLRLIAEDGGAL